MCIASILVYTGLLCFGFTEGLVPTPGADGHAVTLVPVPGADGQEVTLVPSPGADGLEVTLVPAPDADGQKVTDITNIRTRFLVYVGAEYNNCNATVATDYIQAGQNWTDAPTINISTCDSGKFMYKIQQDTQTKQMIVYVNYDTQVYSIGPPPSCNYKWKGDYQVPTYQDMESSPLPGCIYQFMDKQHYKSYFMFQMLMWQWF